MINRFYPHTYSRCKSLPKSLIKISHLTGDDREDFLEELDDDAESSVPELEVAPESQLEEEEEEEGSINDWSMSPLAASTEVAFSTSPWF